MSKTVASYVYLVIVSLHVSLLFDKQYITDKTFVAKSFFTQ